MRATGLDHRTRGLVGLPHTTTANDIIRGTGGETAAAWNTIITRITVGTATSTITIAMEIMTTAGTRSRNAEARGSSRRTLRTKQAEFRGSLGTSLFNAKCRCGDSQSRDATRKFCCGWPCSPVKGTPKPAAPGTLLPPRPPAGNVSSWELA